MNKNNAVITQQQSISINADRICKLNELGLKKDILSQAFRLKIACDFAHHKLVKINMKRLKITFKTNLG